MVEDFIKIIKGKRVRISVAFSGFGDAKLSKTYEGIVDCGASYGNDHFIVLENGTMINTRYVQVIEVL